MVRAKASRRAISSKRSMCRVSREMLTRLRPASARSFALSLRSTPFVVIVMSREGSSSLIIPTSSSMRTRTRGSPPVRRMVRTP